MRWAASAPVVWDRFETRPLRSADRCERSVTRFPVLTMKFVNRRSVPVDLAEQHAARGHRRVEVLEGEPRHLPLAGVLRGRSLDQVLEPGPGRGVERVEQLVEVDLARRLRRRQVAAVGDPRRAGRPEAQIDVAVGDARQRDLADRRGRALAQRREVGIGDVERQLGLAVRRQLDVRDGPDARAGDLDQVAADDLAGVDEIGLDGVRGAAAEDDDRDGDERDEDGRNCGHPADRARVTQRCSLALPTCLLCYRTPRGEREPGYTRAANLSRVGSIRRSLRCAQVPLYRKTLDHGTSRGDSCARSHGQALHRHAVGKAVWRGAIAYGTQARARVAELVRRGRLKNDCLYDMRVRVPPRVYVGLPGETH